MASTADYVALVTNEHSDKPKFIAMIEASCKPFVDITNQEIQYPTFYDIDVAVGAQLDVLGQWIGVSRNLTTALAGVYFAFDTAGLGFDSGVWQGPFDPTTGIQQLPDDYYRIVLKMRVLNNQWDGSKESAYLLMNTVFSPLGYSVYIEDPSDLTMRLGIVGPQVPTPLTVALLTGGKFDIKLAGVRISTYYTQSAPGPIFGFDMNNSLLAGFDNGSWAVPISP